MPSLWDSLNITQGSGPSRHRRLPPDFPKTWFERAGDYRLLSLVVTGRSLEVQDKKYYQDLWDFIQSFASRFRAIAVDDTDLCDKLLQSTLCGLPPLSFSHLEVLYLRLCSPSALDELLVRRCQPPQSLRRIFLRPLFKWHSINKPIIGWDHLTHLDSLIPYPHDTCLKQLRALPRLISCHIYLKYKSPPQNLGPIVTLPFLQHLNLDFDVDMSWITVDFNNPESFLSHIQSLSATLSSLRLNCSTRVYEVDLYPHFIVPHLGKSLTKLSLILVRVGVSDLVEILLCCPGVSELLLQLDYVHQESIALILTRREGDVQSLQLLPSLTHLTLFIYLERGAQYDPKHHADMILSRRTKYPSASDRLPEPLHLYADLKRVVLLHRDSNRGVLAGIDSLGKMKEQEVCRGLELQIFGPAEHTYPRDHRRAITPEEWIYDTAPY